ncbi:outer dense fiber protein 1 [Spea bombifrons]|uniref:outer dense fiber protein 1 n=1 Tax=Spea bombifrons TaxID=233779 RepID=UPI00234B78E9|nr:outer dense fiber protein 1 [Spea bombifrons]
MPSSKPTSSQHGFEDNKEKDVKRKERETKRAAKHKEEKACICGHLWTADDEDIQDSMSASCPHHLMEDIKRDLRHVHRDMIKSLERMEDFHCGFGFVCQLDGEDSDDTMISPKPSKAMDFSQSTDKMFIATIKLDGFSPREISIKVKKGMVVVSGKHEDRYDDNHGKEGYRSKSFCNHFNLPPNVKEKNVRHYFENRRTLRIEAPFSEAINKKTF